MGSTLEFSSGETLSGTWDEEGRFVVERSEFDKPIFREFIESIRVKLNTAKKKHKISLDGRLNPRYRYCDIRNHLNLYLENVPSRDDNTSTSREMEPVCFLDTVNSEIIQTLPFKIRRMFTHTKEASGSESDNFAA
jgi:hypothetical protein